MDAAKLGQQLELTAIVAVKLNAAPDHWRRVNARWNLFALKCIASVRRGQ
jgi:hypothetical protein